MIAFRKSYFIYFLVLKYTLFFSAAAQQLPDSAFYQQARDTLLENYTNASGPNSRLYIGSEYIRNGQKAKGFPFFQSDDPLTGSVYYNDALYSNLQLQYDLVLDGLIINDYTGTGKIELVKENLSYFSIPGHYFVFMAPDRSSSFFMKPGYYEQLYNNRIVVLAKYTKRLIFPSNLEDEPRYEEDNYYFLKMNQLFYKVETKGALLDILKDKKELLKKYIRENKIDFNRKWEESLVKTAAYYDQIKN